MLQEKLRELSKRVEVLKQKNDRENRESMSEFGLLERIVEDASREYEKMVAEMQKEIGEQRKIIEQQQREVGEQKKAIEQLQRELQNARKS